MTLLRCPKFLRCLTADAPNFDRALRRTPPILTAATRSPRFLCHWQRSVRSPHRPASTHSMLRFRRGDPCGRPPHHAPCNASVGATLAVARPLHSLQKPCHCEASAHTGCGNPSPRPIRRGRRPRRPAPQGFLLPVRRGGRLCPPESALHRTPCKNLSLRGQCEHWPWQSASPVLIGPLA